MWRRSGRDSSRTLTLHVGTPKSATTYLQALLGSARREMMARQVLYPGAAYLPAGGLNHQPAVYAHAGPEVRWISDAVRTRGERLMPKLVAELRTHRGPAVLSAEALASFSCGSATSLLDALGYPRDQVHVVVTARDFGRLLASVWQENVKNGAMTTMGDYLESVAALRGAGESPFWTAYGLPELVDRWATVVGLDHVSLVTVPHAARRDELWPRFCHAIGVPDLPEPAPPADYRRNNVSLTPSQIELLREVNTILESEELTHRDRQKLRERLLTAWMSAPGRQARPLELGEALLADVRRWAAEDVATLRERADTGLQVHGDLDELLPVAAPLGSSAGESRPPSVADTAHDVLALVRDGEPESVGR